MDGPGNRTAIFLQGCNIDCKYCHNPETRKLCVQCGTCVRVCPKHCLTMDPAYTPIATAKSCRVVHVPDPKAAVTES